MTSENKHRAGIRLAMPVVVAIVVSLVISLPSEVSAQSTWSDALVSFLASLSMAQETKSGVPSKTGGKGDVTIQSVTAGKIAKFTDGTGQIADSVIAESNGNIGIGTASPSTLLHVAAKTPVFKIQTTAGGTDAFSAYQSKLQLTYDPISDDRAEIWYDHYNAQMYIDQVYPALGNPIYGRIFLRRNASTSLNSPNMQTTMMLDGLGNVGIGTTAPATKLHVSSGDVSVTGTGSVSLTATGNIAASGTISGGNVIAKYQDVAEWVPANRAMPAGTVVTLDPDHSNLVVASSHSYDTRVAGVVSERPGVILGEGGEGKVMVATTGRVRVKVDATNGPIRVGDLLVTSDKEGIAMRSQPIEIAGTPFHRPGTLIGKALEPLEKGVGEILVLLSLQ